MATKPIKPKRALSERQRAHMERLNAKKRVGVIGPVASDGEITTSESDSASTLAQLATLFQTAAKNKGIRTDRFEEIERLLAKLGPNDYPELLESPVVQGFLDQLAERTEARHPDDLPGTIYNLGQLSATKKRWQWRDLAQFPQVTFTPNETIPVTWNGLMIVLQADLEMTVPEPFKQVYDEHKRALETGRQHVAYLFRQRDAIDVNRADPSVIGPQSGLVRGHGQGAGPTSGYKVGAGLFNPGEEAPEGVEAEPAGA